MEPVNKAKEPADLRAELTVEEAWAEALENHKLRVAISAVVTALERAKDAAAAGETAGAVMAELDTVRFAREALMKELDLGDD